MKRTLIFAVLFAICFTAAPYLNAETLMTKGQFAELIIQTNQFELPADVQKLSQEEYQEVIFNVLTSNGIDYFKEGKYEDPVSYDEFASVLYALVGGGELLNPNDQLVYLADHGYIPPDFLVVKDVRAGIQEYYDKNEAWPALLDDAINGNASKDNPFFTKIMAVAVDASWSKDDFFYTAPSTGSIYTYDPVAGTFSAKAPLDLNFAVETFTGFKRPKGEPEDDKELLDT